MDRDIDMIENAKDAACKRDEIVSMFEQAIARIEYLAKFFGTDIDSHFIECLSNDLRKKGIGDNLIQVVMGRLLERNPAQEPMPVEVGLSA